MPREKEKREIIKGTTFDNPPGPPPGVPTIVSSLIQNSQNPESQSANQGQTQENTTGSGDSTTATEE